MNQSTTSPSEEDIAHVAKRIWEEEGRPEGKAEEHWQRAVTELRARALPEAGANSSDNAEMPAAN
ncbi:MAG: DUF2934 domain-containing protein [Chthoniobacteraceae bacterium]